jgi:hypothetical protein
LNDTETEFDIKVWKRKKEEGFTNYILELQDMEDNFKKII